MPARVFERGDLTIAAAIKHHILLADGTRGEFMLDLMAPGRGIPGVQRERLGLGHGVLPLGHNLARDGEV